MPKRKDNNQAAIKKALQAVGLHCYDTANLGYGFPDLVVVRDDGRVFLVELKAEDWGRMTPDEVLLQVSLVNPCYRVFVDVEKAIRAMRDS